ncbi:MarR family winged helix-turn-helix transcriptional regulator [Fodinicola acaciae]|uniref:MarR family winged helix-turn-helix transcriptional regulator n=1 Tax=Fodinicola acaciae TaxID=2681555 RepID=UPI0013D70B1C|nr:MarR family transcriptional regulator [Fodinicola acaciae]
MSVETAEPLVIEWRALQVRYAQVSCAIERALQEEHGLGLSEFEALDRLMEIGDQCRGQQLVDLLPLSQSAASRLIARLERDGLVERTVCENDRRAIFVRMTDAGRARYDVAKTTQRKVLAETLR